VRDHSTSNTGDVATKERNTGLLQPVIGGFRLPEVSVYHVDCGFERRKLYHRIRNLARPERIETFVETRRMLASVNARIQMVKILDRHEKHLPAISLFSNDLGPSFSQTMCERRQGSLHPNLNRLKRAECNIRKELCTRTSSQIYDCLVRIWEYPFAIRVFEDLVESIFSTTLQTIPNERWCPAEEDTSDTFSTVDGTPGSDSGFVPRGIDLSTAFYKIERGDGGVGWTAGWEKIISFALIG
jgi:hypothetical protein